MNNQSEMWAQRRQTTTSALSIAMKQGGLSVADVAKELGVTYQVAYKWVRGQSTPQSPRLRLRLMEFCDRTIADSLISDKPGITTGKPPEPEGWDGSWILWFGLTVIAATAASAALLGQI